MEDPKPVHSGNTLKGRVGLYLYLGGETGYNTEMHIGVKYVLKIDDGSVHAYRPGYSHNVYVLWYAEEEAFKRDWELIEVAKW